MFNLFTTYGTYGASQNPADIHVYYERGVSWYAVDCSLNVNCVAGEIPPGVDVETLEDIDTMTAGEPIESPEDIEALLDD